MNEQQRAKVQQALKTLEKWDGVQTHYRDRIDCSEAITALRQLLEQPEQGHDHALEQALTRLQKRYSELEAKVGAQPDIGDELTIAYMDGMYQGKQMAKREWVGLTPEQVRACFFAGEPPASSPPHWWEYRNPDYMAIYNNIAGKLKEKNT